MSTRLRFALLVSCTLGLAGASVSLAGSVPICHVPPGHPSNLQLLNVAPAAVRSHVLNHGDAVCSGTTSDCCLQPVGEVVCTNLQISEENCGECGFVCGVDQHCIAGECLDDDSDDDDYDDDR